MAPPALVFSSPSFQYRKGPLIGYGGFGFVCTGINLDSGGLLAIKQVPITAGNENALRELESEAKMLENLSHPNIVKYFGMAREADCLSMILEFVPGGSIYSLLCKFGAFPEALIRNYTKQLLLGLDHLHKKGIMHRDIKGGNILVDDKGCIKLADFGASKQVDEFVAFSGAKSLKGTPYWMAPEVILQSGHSFSADIWSVGCTVIEMATGMAPWSQQYQPHDAMIHVASTKSHPEIPGHLSTDAKDFLLKCFEREPSMRPDTSSLLKHPFVTGLDSNSTQHIPTQITVAPLSHKAAIPEISQLLSLEAEGLLLKSLLRELNAGPDVDAATPAISHHLSLEAEGILPKCLFSELNIGPKVSTLVQENYGVLSQSKITGLQTCQVASLSVASDLCNLGSFNSCFHSRELFQTCQMPSDICNLGSLNYEDMCEGIESHEDMSPIDTHQFSVSVLASDEFLMVYDFIDNLSVDQKCLQDDNQAGANMTDTNRLDHEGNYPSSPSFEADNEFADSYIAGWIPNEFWSNESVGLEPPIRAIFKGTFVTSEISTSISCSREIVGPQFKAELIPLEGCG